MLMLNKLPLRRLTCYLQATLLKYSAAPVIKMEGIFIWLSLSLADRSITVLFSSKLRGAKYFETEPLLELFKLSESDVFLQEKSKSLKANCLRWLCSLVV
jgi:hypothetical protein